MSLSLKSFLEKNKKKIHIVLLFTISLILVVVFNTFKQNQYNDMLVNKNFVKQPFSHLQLSNNFQNYTIKVTEEELKTGAFGTVDAVSIVQVEKNKFLIASYDTISLITIKENNLSEKKQFSKPNGVNIWNPAGLFYSKKDNLLYVANYRGHDILIFDYNQDSNSLSLKQRITDDKLQSPENVVVNSLGEIIVADYDSSKIFKFDHKGNFIWRTQISQTHGVTILGENIYTTSLTDRIVVKLDYNGHILKKQGSLGIKYDQYQWPVSIMSIDNNKLVVTDAHTGRLTILNENLEVLDTFGGNGPGVDLFNYPYAFLQVDDGYLIADTLKARIVKLSKSWKIEYQLVTGDKFPQGINQPIIHGTEKTPYSYPQLYAIDILNTLGIDLHYSDSKPIGGFNSIDFIDQDGLISKELEIDDPKIPYFFGKNFWYMTGAKLIQVNNYNLILTVSPQQKLALLIDIETGLWNYVDFPVATWLINNEFVTNYQSEIDLNKIISPSINKFQQTERLILKGISPSESYRMVFAKNIKQENFQKEFWQQILSSSEVGKEFYQNIFVKNNNVQSSAYKYFSKIYSKHYLYLQEILAVKYLAGSDFKFQSLNNLVKITSMTKFYPGNNIDIVLNNPKLDRYASALEGQENYSFALEIDNKAIPKILNLEWLDSTNYPVDYEIVLLDKNKQKIQDILVTNNEDINNSIEINNKIPTKFIKVKINKFHGQQRLLIKQVNLFGQIPEIINTSLIKKLTEKISNYLEYSGERLVKFENLSLEETILKNGYGHCGHFGFLLVSEIKKRGGKSYLWDIMKANGIFHSLAEVYDEEKKAWIVADPTVGIIYEDNLSNLINNSDKKEVKLNDPKKANQFSMYYGTNFFSGDITNLRRYNSLLQIANNIKEVLK